MRASTRMSALLAGLIPSTTSTGISFDASSGVITRSEGSFLIDGHRVSQHIEVSGSGSNNGRYKITSMGSDGLTIVVDGTLTDESAGASVTVAMLGTFSMESMLRYGKILFFSGSRPSNADIAPSGTKLMEITLNRGTFTAGSTSNAIVWTAGEGAISMPDSASWEGLGVAAGTIGYAMITDNFATELDDTDNSVNAVRAYLTAGVGSSYEINLSSTTISKGSPEKLSELTWAIKLTTD